MADKGRGEIVRLLAWSVWRHVGCFNVQRLTRTKMTDLATIDDPIIVYVKLMTENRVVERVLVLVDEIVDALLR